MTEEIYVGFDCCNDYRYPKRTPRIYPDNITLPLDGVVRLDLRVVHPECYDSCFTWNILKGGGYLEPELGVYTNYHAPHWQEDCLESPLIEVRCPRKSLDKIRIGVTGTQRPIPAVFVARQWEQPEFELAHHYPHLVGMKYCDKVPKVHFWTIRIDEYDCNGTRLHRHQVRLVNQLVEAWCGIKIQANVFRSSLLINKTKAFLTYPYHGSLEATKKYLLNYWLFTGVLPSAGKLDYNFQIYGAKWPKGKTFLLAPGTILDIRMDKVIEMECCPLQLIQEE